MTPYETLRTGLVADDKEIFNVAMGVDNMFFGDGVTARHHIMMAHLLKKARDPKHELPTESLPYFEANKLIEKDGTLSVLVTHVIQSIIDAPEGDFDFDEMRLRSPLKPSE